MKKIVLSLFVLLGVVVVVYSQPVSAQRLTPTSSVCVDRCLIGGQASDCALYGQVAAGTCQKDLLRTGVQCKCPTGSGTPTPSVAITPLISTTPISATPDPTDYCKPINKIIKMTTGSEPGYCKDLQKAINSVSEDGVKILLLDGDYTFPDNGDNFTLKIQNKTNLEITSARHDNPFDTKVALHFPKNRGGILIDNSSGNFGWMKVDGATNNGLLRVINSNDLDLSNLNIQDSSALTVDIEDSKNIRVSASVIKSSATGLNAENVDNLSIGGNQFTNSVVGVQVKNITNLFLFNSNLVYANSQKGLYIINSTKGVKIQNNTFDKISKDNLTADSAAVHLFSADDVIFNKNIIAQSPV